MGTYEVPKTVRLMAGPTGMIATAQEASLHLGNLEIDSPEAAETVAMINRQLGSAMDYVEEELLYSFRRRSLRAEFEGAYGVVALFPWGPASDIRVTAGGEQVPHTEELHGDNITVVRVDRPDFTVEWNVGSEDEFPALATEAVLKVLTALWHDRGFFEPEDGNRMTHPAVLLGKYNLSTGWE